MSVRPSLAVYVSVVAWVPELCLALTTHPVPLALEMVNTALSTAHDPLVDPETLNDSEIETFAPARRNDDPGAIETPSRSTHDPEARRRRNESSVHAPDARRLIVGATLLPDDLRYSATYHPHRSPSEAHVPGSLDWMKIRGCATHAELGALRRYELPCAYRLLRAIMPGASSNPAPSSLTSPDALPLPFGRR